MALFMVLAMLVGAQVLLRNLVTEGRSEREAEMIWRGNQYVRAIRAYYRKTGHYPQKQEDLLTGVPSLHFLRSEAIKDPMNKDNDGAWRFIYSNAAGQIFGSVKYGSMQQMAMMDMNGGQMPGTQQGSGTDTGTDSSQSSASSSVTQPGGTPGTATAGVGTNGGRGTTLGPGQVMGPLGQPAQAMGAMQPTGPLTSPMIGGQLVGVGSTVDRAAVRVYKGGKKYNEWEFIWNPLEEQARQLQQGLGTNGQPGGVPGLNLPGLPLGPTNGIPGPGTGGTMPGPGGANGFPNGPNNFPNNPTGPSNNPGGLAPNPVLQNQNN